MPASIYVLQHPGQSSSQVGSDGESTTNSSTSDFFEATNVLRMKTRQQQHLYHKFRMDQSSFPIQLAGCIFSVIAAFVFLVVVPIESSNPFWIIRFMCTIICPTLGVLYTLHLAEHKKVIRSCNIIKNLNPNILCNCAVVLFVFNSCIQLLSDSKHYKITDTEQQWNIVYDFLLIPFQLTANAVFFRVTDWYVSVFVGVMGGTALVVGSVMLSASNHVISLCVFIGVIIELCSYMVY